MSENIDKKQEVETTGHVWDGVQEFNNPLPRWWLLSFYGTVIFSLIYWVLYPTWPLPNNWTKGIKTVQVKEGGEVKELNWNTRTLLAEELQSSTEAKNRDAFYGKLGALKKLEDIQATENEGLKEFALSTGAVMFADNCATCHGAGGEGKFGLYPNLTDDAWLWGGHYSQIEQTITMGRTGNMTPASLTGLTDDEITDVAKYALTLSGNYTSDEASERGKVIFEGKGTCYTCHGPDGKGVVTMGGANLTDQIWELVPIFDAKTDDEKVAMIRKQVIDGVTPATDRVMPTWKDRLTKEQIRALAVYVHELGGGQ
ncbi:cytochrome-c oxidase, cbb3-type subunit III [Wohlfahrtiimonas larvae]|uniref:Cbb3-type cytochrome c oxidase subunit n=1 Tax=Wohlfahrtiimonas larvae TaxID=1157986 RepID=A0ABP9MGC6_9GAMM|nr:cytochrome-c oxidase, cbb3-type subunit III [Wohlfahrtiimonas larvae]